MLRGHLGVGVALGSLGLLAFACYEARPPTAATSDASPQPMAAETSGVHGHVAQGGGQGRGPSAGSQPEAMSGEPIGAFDASTGRDAAPGANPQAATDPKPGADPRAPADPKPGADPTRGGMHGAPEPGFATQPRRLSPTAPELRIAFLGDQSMGPDAHAVLRLIAREKADAVVHLGDFAYDVASPTRWQAQIDSALGPDFPYFAAVGNHDVANWSGPGGFAEVLRARLARVPEARCSGELGVNSLCRFRGLSFVLSGVGTYGREHEAYLESALSQVPSAFRLCLWHKNQHDMQVGGKLDEVGWEAYRICARHGALIITAHEHSYARTRTLEAISDRSRGHGATGRPDALTLEPGSTAVIVTGLGGHSARAHTDDHNQDSWWASVYAQDYQLQNAVEVGRAPNIQFGALFIDFHVEGDPFRAFGYFKTTDGAIHDRFVLQTAHYARGK